MCIYSHVTNLKPDAEGFQASLLPIPSAPCRQTQFSFPSTYVNFCLSWTFLHKAQKCILSAWLFCHAKHFIHIISILVAILRYSHDGCMLAKCVLVSLHAVLRHFESNIFSIRSWMQSLFLLALSHPGVKSCFHLSGFCRPCICIL